MTDAQLLEAYSSRQDDNAFAELMRRHAAMVYRTCHRLLKDVHEAEDASQAVFVVLARKAAGLRKGDLSAWLYRVAHHVAAETVRKRMHRTKREESYAAEEVILTESSAAGDIPDPALLGLVDAALLSLPDRYREAVILRYLRNRSETEAAQLAGCAVGTLSMRASRGIQRLRQHFARRGVTLSGAALAGLLASEASAAVPETLLPSILASVKGLAAATAAGTGATSSAIALAKGAMHAMFIAKVKTAALITAACLVVASTGTVTAQKIIASAPPATAAPAPTNSALNRDQLITLAEAEAGKTWREKHPDANFARSGFYKPNKPDGCVRDVRVEQKAENWEVEVHATLTIAGKRKNIHHVLVVFDAAGHRVGDVVLEEFDGNATPAPKAALTGNAANAPAADPLRFTEADNGKTVTVKVGQKFEVVLLNGREGAGWEPAATEITGTSVELVNKLRRGNCDERMAEKAPTPDTTLGMYKYKYNAVKIGTSIIRLYHLIPSGPVPKPRNVTGSLGEFKLTVDVLAEGAPIGNPANDPNVHPLVRVEDSASGMVVRALDSINSFSIAAYAKDGKMVWQVKLPRRAEGLTIANGKVFVQPDGSTYDLQTGTTQGKFQ